MACAASHQLRRSFPLHTATATTAAGATAATAATAAGCTWPSRWTCLRNYTLVILSHMAFGTRQHNSRPGKAAQAQRITAFSGRRAERRRVGRCGGWVPPSCARWAHAPLQQQSNSQMLDISMRNRERSETQAPAALQAQQDDRSPESHPSCSFRSFSVAPAPLTLCITPDHIAEGNDLLVWEAPCAPCRRRGPLVPGPASAEAAIAACHPLA